MNSEISFIPMEKLTDSLSGTLHSASAIFDLGQALEELICNSIDAGATIV